MARGLLLWARQKDEERVGQTSVLASPTPRRGRVSAQGPLSFPVLPAQRRAKVPQPHMELATHLGHTHLHTFIRLAGACGAPTPFQRVLFQAVPWAAAPPSGPDLLGHRSGSSRRAAIRGSLKSASVLRQGRSQASAGGGAGQGELWGARPYLHPLGNLHWHIL